MKFHSMMILSRCANGSTVMMVSMIGEDVKGVKGENGQIPTAGLVK